MKVYEMKIKVYLKKDLKIDEVQYELYKLISSYLSRDEKMLKLHNSKGYKPYCYDWLYPIEKNIYKKGNNYNFRIRSIDEELINYFLNGFEDFINDTFKNLTLEIREIRKEFIDKLYTLTPVVIKNDTGYWVDNLSLEQYEKRLNDNIQKKYIYFNKDKIIECKKFYKSIIKLNDNPISVKYKNIKLLGDKMEMVVNEDTISQELAYLSLGVTFSEMNSSGFGFLGYKYL